MKPVKASQVKVKNFPQCVNKKQARMVCLNEGCEQHAFFCLSCDDESCESIHRHDNHQDKLMAIGFKQFIRRVLRQRKPTEQLQSALTNYRQTLERLRSDINQFVDRELKNLTDILNRATQVGEELQPLVRKIKEEKYVGLKGKEMDFLWQNCGDTQENQKIQAQTADFLRIKDEELKAISEHFENLNKLNFDKAESDPKDLNNPSKRQSPSPSLPSQTKNTKPDATKSKK